jgi:hypothetical protein
MTDDNYYLFFGEPDAEQESADQLKNYYYKIVLVNRLKVDDKDKGSAFVIGAKGSGKTAICRMIERKNGLIWKLSKLDGIEVGNSTDRLSSYYESLLVVHLLSKYLDLLLKEQESYSDEAKKGLPTRFEQFIKKAAHLLGDTKISPDLKVVKIEIDVGKLMRNSLQDISKVSCKEFKDVLEPCLKEKRGYILIDDVDDIFPGLDSNFEFLEGLLRAVTTINKEFGNLLHCLIFLKSGIFSRYLEHGRNFDWFAGKEIVLRWLNKDLTEVIAARARVAVKNKDKQLGSLESWQLVFSGNIEEIKKIQEYTLKRTNSGPRDIIHFCNLAKSTVSEKKISFSAIKSIEQDYSRFKLYSLNSNYEKQYGDIANLLLSVFRRKPSTYHQGILEELIQTEILGNKDRMSEFGATNLLKSYDATYIIERLFDFGFIGYREFKDSEFIYSNDLPPTISSPGRKLLQAFEHSIHPAYWSHLLLNAK